MSEMSGTRLGYRDLKHFLKRVGAGEEGKPGAL